MSRIIKNNVIYANGVNRQVFFETPTVPYAVGDLWLGNGNVWYCTTAKSSGEYAEEDWDATVDYDEAARALVNETVACVTGNSEGGGNVILHLNGDGVPYEMLFTDNVNPASVSKIWKFDSTGFKFSPDHGQSYTPITNANGELDATFITSGVLDASKVSIVNLSTSDITAGDLYRGGTDNNLGTIIIKNQQNVVIGEINKLGVKLYGPGNVGSRPYIVFNDTDFFAGYDANNNLIFKVEGSTVNMVNATVTNNLTVGNKTGYKISFVPITITENGTIVNDGIAIV